MEQKTKTCQNCKTRFTIAPEDLAFYERIKVPAPTWCPWCRDQRRLAFRNERSLYQRTCDLCQKNIISVYSPDKPFVVYCPPCWYSDRWDPLSYGREYDFSRSFFEQFKELQRRVPRISIIQDSVVNSPWVNYERGSKNCYLNVGGEDNEDSAYCTYALSAKDSYDAYWLLNSNLCYEDTYCERCSRTFFSFWCFDCHDTWFSYDCSGCSYIIGCAGLRNKQYYIFNKPYSKEDFFEMLKTDMRFGSRRALTDVAVKAAAVAQKMPHKASFINHSTASTGNFLDNCRNCQNCWQSEGGENAKHLFVTAAIKESYDLSSVGWGELLYEVMSGAQLYSARCSMMLLRDTREMDYCDFAINSNDCFGSVSLRNTSYCILDKRYTKEEYGKLRARIIARMNEEPYADSCGRTYRYGEFFPPEFSPFGYNESVSAYYYPLQEDEARERGFHWSTYESPDAPAPSGYTVPDDISDVKDDILKQILADEETGKSFRLIPAELAFYRQMRMPIPGYSPTERHKQRFARIAHRTLYRRTCQKCNKDIETIYAPDRPEIVYCKSCYNSEVA